MRRGAGGTWHPGTRKVGSWGRHGQEGREGTAEGCDGQGGRGAGQVGNNHSCSGNRPLESTFLTSRGAGGTGCLAHGSVGGGSELNPFKK